MTGGTMGFIIWSVCCLFFLLIGVYAWNAKKPVKFWNVADKKELLVSDMKKYNHAVAALWFSFAAAFEGLGLFMLAGQNSALIIVPILGGMFLSILLMAVYNKIEKKYRICD